jgi:hypothetical protein
MLLRQSTHSSAFRGAQGASPESITTIGEYGFPACANWRIRNDTGEIFGNLISDVSIS